MSNYEEDKEQKEKLKDLLEEQQAYQLNTNADYQATAQEQPDEDLEGIFSEQKSMTYQSDLEAQQRGENPNGEAYAEQADAAMGFQTGVPDGKQPGEVDAQINQDKQQQQEGNQRANISPLNTSPKKP